MSEDVIDLVKAVIENKDLKENLKGLGEAHLKIANALSVFCLFGDAAGNALHDIEAIHKPDVVMKAFVDNTTMVHLTLIDSNGELYTDSITAKDFYTAYVLVIQALVTIQLTNENLLDESIKTKYHELRKRYGHVPEVDMQVVK